MITAMDRGRNKLAILENAFEVSYDKQLSAVWTLKFRMHIDDPKNDDITQFGYVEVIDDSVNEFEDEYIGLFRVSPVNIVVNDANRYIEYTCLHVLSTLVNNVLFRVNRMPANTPTSDSINFLLKKQSVVNWKLGTCAFRRFFEYEWENENGLLEPLWSIPKDFGVEHQWTWDTTVYPWVINLIEPTTTPVCRLREGWNLTGFSIDRDTAEVINRVYPIGTTDDGEDLTIESVNPTKKAYVENPQSINKHGAIEYIWRDQRYKNAKNLYDAAKVMVAAKSEIVAVWTVNAIDLIKSIDSEDVTNIDKLRLGTIVRIITEDYGQLDMRIIKESKSDIFGDPGELELELKSTDVRELLWKE